MRFCLQFDTNAKNGFYTHSLHLTQHPIDAILQFDANAHEDANAYMHIANEALTFAFASNFNNQFYGNK